MELWVLLLSWLTENKVAFVGLYKVFSMFNCFVKDVSGLLVVLFAWDCTSRSGWNSVRFISKSTHKPYAHSHWKPDGTHLPQESLLGSFNPQEMNPCSCIADIPHRTSDVIVWAGYNGWFHQVQQLPGVRDHFAPAHGLCCVRWSQLCQQIGYRGSGLRSFNHLFHLCGFGC